MMKRDSKSVAKILFTVCLLLLISNLILEKLYPESKSDMPAVTQEEADTVFRKVLDDFGIQRSWYKKQNDNYIIMLPVDLPAEVIMIDVSEKYKERNACIKSKEIVKNQKSLMEFISGGKTLFTAEFVYNKTNIRETPFVSFILMNINSLDINETDILLNSSDKFTVALIPSKSNRWFADSLVKMGRQYVVLLNSDIDELEYRLDDKFSDKKLVTTFQTITANFSQAEFFILDDISAGYSERVNGILMNELSKRRIKHFQLNSFSQIENSLAPADVNQFIVLKRDKIFCIDASDFIKLQNELRQMRKRGTRIVGVSSVH